MMKSVVSSLLPKETPIELFIEHVDLLREVSNVMEELVRTYFDRQDISELVTFISDKESDADEVKFEFRRMLDKNVKVLFPKPSLINAIHIQDDIIDMMEDIAKKMSMNYLDFDLDEAIQQDFLQLVNEVQKIIRYLEEVIYELKRVTASVFAKRERKKEEKDIIKIEGMESNIDRLTVKLGKWSYSKKGEFNPIDLIFFNDLVMIFAEIGDKAENLAELMRSFTR